MFRNLFTQQIVTEILLVSSPGVNLENPLVNKTKFFLLWKL